MKFRIIIILMVFASYSLKAQQDAMFTHYMFNTLQVNPAYAGSRDALTLTALHRTQWLDFEGAPITQTVTMHTPVAFKGLGMGVSVINDQLGPTNFKSFYADLAYSLKITKRAKLALGLKGGFNIVRIGLTDLAIHDVDDEVFSEDYYSKLLPNVGFGLYYHTPVFYTGLSTPRLVQNSYDNVGTDLGNDQRHYFYIMGFVTKLSDNYKLKPTTYVKATSGAPIEADITTSLLYKDRYWGGLMYRTGDAAGMMGGMNISEQIQLGYSFDWSFGVQTGTYNKGSHEIMLRYDFIYKELDKIKSPRYF